jgi:hypothetical protein
MPFSPWIVALSLALAGAWESSQPRERPAGRSRVDRGGIRGVWLGQDGHDLVGPTPAVKPNDVQDIHIALTGLPAGRAIVSVQVLPQGGGEWAVRGPHGSWGAAIVRAAGAATADLFVEPYQRESGRPLNIQLKFDDGATADFWIKGGKADPNLRMPGARLGVAWQGQDGQDWTAPGPSVGPDGREDVRLTLAKLSPRVEVQSIRVAGSNGARWQFGVNPEGDSNAELVRDPRDPARGDLFFQPDRDLAGQTLRVDVAYANGKTDSAVVTGGKSDPQRAMPAPSLPALVPNAIAGRWLGQDRGDTARRGSVHVALNGLPTGRSIAAVVLSDSVRGLWVARLDDRVGLGADPEERPLVVRLAPDHTRADLFFLPYRDESGTNLTLRLIFDDGAMAVARLAGGACDPGLKVPGPSETVAHARPGDDLHELANRFSTVRLAAGTYRLDRPLVLDHPVTLTGQHGTTLLFAQRPDDEPWTTAIKFHAGHTTLTGFAVRFAGPVRWREGVSYAPAVIGATDNFDASPHDDPKVDITLTNLDIEAPPVADPRGRSPAPSLIRLFRAASGRVVGNVLKGGAVELFGGPWQVLNNDYRGTVPGTVATTAFGTHQTHDLVVRGNHARPIGPSGKTWRFLVMTTGGHGDRVEDNTVEAIGPRDDDTIPWENAPEVVLTESYRLHFEGRPAAVSADGQVVAIGRLQGPPARTGDVVAVLSGPHAGQFRKVAQAIGPATYLLDEPLPAKDNDAIAIATGFVREVFQGNTIDSRGGQTAANLVLVGNHYGTVVRRNRLVGGGESFKITAAPTEEPRIWGWSHAPFLGGVIEGNTIEDAEQGGSLGVEHSGTVKSSRGRVYMAVSLRDNTVRWTAPFLARYRHGGPKTNPSGLTVGGIPTLDPGELVVNAAGNRLDAPAGMRPPVTLRILAATFNGRRIVNQGFALPP